MTTLTSIASLRKSSAEQERVTTVENFLKRLNKEWKADWWFPISIIALSNDQDDCSWVRSHSSVHHKGEGNVLIGERVLSATEVIDSFKGLTVKSEEDLSKINQLPLLSGLDWTQGIRTMDMTEVKGQQTSEELNVRQQAPDQVAVMTNMLAEMETADIMAVLTAVNAARGGLLKGAQPDELTTFIHTMTGNRALIVEWPAGVQA